VLGVFLCSELEGPGKSPAGENGSSRSSCGGGAVAFAMAIKLFLVFVSSQGFDRFTILGFACYLILLASAQFVVLRAAHYRPARLQTIYAFGWLRRLAAWPRWSRREHFFPKLGDERLELLPVFGVAYSSCSHELPLHLAAAGEKALAPESDPPRAIPRIPRRFGSADPPSYTPP